MCIRDRPYVGDQRNDGQCKGEPDKNLFKYNKDTIKMKYQQNDHDHLGSCFKSVSYTHLDVYKRQEV